MATIGWRSGALIGAACLALLTAGCTTTEMSGSNAAAARPVLQTSFGPVVGTREGTDGKVMVFRGVRYGASTEGRRFEVSQAPSPWTAPQDASDYAADCAQIPSGNVPVFASWANERPNSEDCLFLNVWTRGMADGKKRPVMVWLHGGGYVTGSGSSHGYDGARLAERGDVVVITINHRLGAFGYLDVSDISSDPRYADSGNNGTLDMIRALRWVRDNAAAFGGDAANVTIFGESGGAAKVATLMGAESAKGLFHKAIGQSGSMSLAGFEPRVATALANDVIKTAALPAGDVAALAAMPMDNLITTLTKTRTRGAYFRPVIDGRTMTRNQFEPDASPAGRDVPLLVGTNNNEMRLQGGLADPKNFALTWEELPGKIAPLVGTLDPAEIIAGMRRIHPGYTASDVFFQVATFRNYRSTAIRQAERKSAQGGAPVYMYRLDWRTPVEGGRLGTPHALDIGFVFDNVAKSLSMSGDGPDQQRLAELMSSAWIAFARTGDPNTPALPQWPRYDAATRATMIFDVPPKVVNDPDGAEREFLMQLPQGRE